MGESVRQILARESAGGRASVRGWVKTARHSKGVSFLEVSDGSCLAGLQGGVTQITASPRPQNAHFNKSFQSNYHVKL